MRARVWLSVVMLLAGAGLLAAAGIAEPAQKKGGTLRISRGRDLDSVDPALAYNPDSWMLEFVTCAKLYNYPDKPAPAGAIAIPEVATGFPRVSRDGKTATIQLNRTYRFHTGARITAANFVAAFNRDANHAQRSPAVTYLHEIAGADAVINGQAQTISGVRAIGPYTLQIRMTRPVPDLVFRLTLPFFCPIAVNTPIGEIEDPLGSGPYYVASRVPNRQTVLKRNRFYRGPRPANVDQIVFTINGLEACKVAVEQNELDLCAGGGVPAADIPEIVATYGINRTGGQFFFNPTLGILYFAFNHDRPAFKGPGQIPLAMAINWAIDRPALERAEGFLGGKRSDQILPRSMTRPAHIYPIQGVSQASLSRARALLKRAKLRPANLVLYTDDLPPDLTSAQIFQFNLKRIGIDVEIKVFPHTGYYDIVGIRGAPYDVAIAGWIADFPDGDAFFRPLLYGPGITKSGNFNLAYFDSPRYNREIERIEGLSGKARNNAWADLDVQMMRDDPPWAPVLTFANRDFVSKSFGCYLFQPAIGRPDLAAACKK
jgi:ABC-type oligopeptide transport system substrate-binding subunit